MGFLATILFFVLFIGLFILLAVFGFIRSIFSFGRNKNPKQNNQDTTYQQPKSKSKIFDQKEGEYVDYEEIDKD